jgi:Fuc2NAc and GlcNAc transferase
MYSYFLLFLVLLSFALTYLVRKITIKYSIIDIPNERSSHTVSTPRGGGMAVAFTWFVGISYFWWNNKITIDIYLGLLTAIPLVIMGAIDDIISLKPSIRFAIQLLTAGVALYFIGGLNAIIFEGGPIKEIHIFNVLAFFAIIWSINLFNFLDGIDGYIGTEVIFIGISIYLLTNDMLGLLLAASVLGFLFLNWQKAKIFMGDVGSTLLGFTIAVLAIYHQNTCSASLGVWLILTSVFWFDATVTLLRRVKNKEKLSQAHRKHAYQRIVQAGFSHQKTVLYSLLLNIIGFGLAWLCIKYPKLEIIFLVLDILLLYIVMRLIDKRKPFEYSKQ